MTEAAQIRHLRVHVLGNLSELNLAGEDYPAARQDAAQALALAREIEEQYLIATRTQPAGRGRNDAGRIRRRRTLFSEGRGHRYQPGQSLGTGQTASIGWARSC